MTTWIENMIRAPFSFRKYRDYWPALLGAMLINIILFALMPVLIQRIPGKPDLKPLETIQVVRMKRPDTDVRKKEKPPPTPEKKEIIKDRKPLSVSKPVQRKIRLPFQLNPKFDPVDLESLIV